MKTNRSVRSIAAASLCALTVSAAWGSAGSAHALDTTDKPKKAHFNAAARALDVVEDAIILGQPLPAHDPALGDRKVRLTVTTPGYQYAPWDLDNPQRAVGSIDIQVSAKGVAPGPLTVWVKAGGHACVPGTKSRWQRVSIPNGGTLSFELEDKWYSTAIFLRVSDVQHRYRYESINVQVATKEYADGSETPAVIDWG